MITKLVLEISLVLAKMHRAETHFSLVFISGCFEYTYVRITHPVTLLPQLASLCFTGHPVKQQEHPFSWVMHKHGSDDSRSTNTQPTLQWLSRIAKNTLSFRSLELTVPVNNFHDCSVQIDYNLNQYSQQ